MPAARQNNLLPLWDPASVVVDGGIGPSQSSIKSSLLSTDQLVDCNTTMLITVPEELENVLRDVLRDDGVDEALRRKISEHLDREVIKDAGGDGSARKQRALPPSILAQAVSHVRRLRPTGAGGMLKLLRGGGQLVFLDSQPLPPKVGEEKRAYDERREWLLMRREQKDYARMTANIQTAPRESVRDIQEGFKFQAGMGANMILAVVSSFIVSYWASKYVAPNNKGHRLVIGLVGAVFILLVELLVFVTRSLKADEVLQAARRDAEESRTAVGVPRAASVPAPPRRRGRGVLDTSGRRGDRSRGEYEMVPPVVGANEGDPLVQSGSEETKSNSVTSGVRGGGTAGSNR